MARIAGINIPQNKLVHIGLTYIYGIGDKFSDKICSSLEIPKKKRVNDQFCLLTQKKVETCKGWLKGLHATLIRFTKGSPNGKKASYYST